MNKQMEVVKKLKTEGWLEFMPKNDDGWKFFFRRNPNPGSYHEYWGVGYLYCTLFPSGIITDGIIETRNQRWKRRRAEILLRDFRDYPWGEQWS